MTKTKTLQIGITSLLGNGKHVILWESDNEFNIKDFRRLWYYHFGINRQLTIYKSNKGYHMISLNHYDYYTMINYSIIFLEHDMICNKQLGFAIRQEAFTLRITEKIITTDLEYQQFQEELNNFKFESIIGNVKPKEIIYHQWGSLPISKSHYEVFKLFLNNPEFDISYKHNGIKEGKTIEFFDHGYELKGYAWEE